MPVSSTPSPAPSRLNVLVSYPYTNDAMVRALMAAPDRTGRLIVDSGAFTAFNMGQPIKLADYEAFVREVGDDLRAHWAEVRFVQLDEYGDHDATVRNYHLMREHGFDPMPVYTRGAPLSWLEECYAATDYVMFGGIVAGGGSSALREVMPAVGDRRIHWLGFMNRNYLVRYRPTSVDSSAWMCCCRFGRLTMYLGGGRLQSHRRPFFQGRDVAPALRKWMAAGRTAAEFRLLRESDEAWRTQYSLAQRITTDANLRRMIECEQHLGTIIYHVCPTSTFVELLYAGMRDLKEGATCAG